MSASLAVTDFGKTTPASYLSSDINYVLQNLNNDYVNSLIPTLIYVSVLMAVGLVGNITVLLVYFKKYKPSTSRTYILAIGVFDLLANCLSLPGDILEILYFYTFDMPDLCRGIRFVKMFLTTVSSAILVAVAIHRYYKICQPLRQKKIRIPTYVSIAVCAGASAAVSISYIMFIGRHTLQTGIANVTGVTCTVADSYVNSSSYRIFLIFTYFVFFGSVIMMTLSYALIARKLWRHRKRAAGVIYGGDASSSVTNTVEERSHDERETSVERNHDDNKDFNSSLVKLKSAAKKGLVPTNKIRNTFSTTHFTHIHKIEDQSSENSLRNISEEHSMEDCLIASKHNDVNINAAVTPTYKTVVMLSINGSATTNVTNSGGEDSHSQEPGVEVVQAEKILDNSTNENGCQVNGRAHDTAISSSAQHSVSLLRNTTLTENSERAETELTSNPKSKNKHPKKTGSGRKIPSRTTLMMFVMTVIFIFNYLPYLTISFVMVGQYELEKNLSPLVLNLYQIADRSYFLNCAVNAIVYSFCSARFRQECQRLFCVFSEVRFLCWKK